jgi:hypothetical protein
MSDEHQAAHPAGDKLPARSVKLRSGAKVTLVREVANERSMLVFTSVAGDETTVMLSDAALAAVVALAVTKAGVPINVG